MPAPGPSPAAALSHALDALFDAERDVRRAHAELADATPAELLPVLETAIHASTSNDDEDERALRLVRIAALLGEIDGAKPVDLLIDILGSQDPEARHAAGVALEDRAYDRFKEVALGVERAVDRLPSGHLALAELPYLLADIPEPGVMKLLARFLAHGDAEAVGAAIEAVVEVGDPAGAALLTPLLKDTRAVVLEDDEGEEGKVTVGELAQEAREILSPPADKGPDARKR